MLDHNLVAGGFFHAHHQAVRASVDDVTLKNFTNLEDDTSRVSFIRGLQQIRDFDVRLHVTAGKYWPKSIERARELKNEGNGSVQTGNWHTALSFYTQSYVRMPINNDNELAIIIANRSAALYYLKHYELALLDIDRALSLGYPKDLKYKILDRKAKCYLALKWNREAISAFQETLTSLDDAKLPKDKCKKKQTDAQLMIEILEKSLQMANPKNKKVLDEKPKVVGKKIVDLPIVAGKEHPVHQGASDFISIESNEAEGRYAIANKNIDVGETLIVEKAHCSVLLEMFSKTHCQHCFERCVAPVPCDSCANVIFCNEQCKNEAVYHIFECPLLPIIWESGCSITCHMALRMITQKSVGYFTRLRPKLGEGLRGKSSHDDYRRAYNLVGHEKIRSKADLFQRTHMAVFLLDLLSSTTYFEGDADSETFVGSLVLKNLQVLQFNAHEIFELHCDRSAVVDGCLKRHLGKSVFLGGGLFPTLALLNHSCEPGIVRYFRGTSVVAKSVKNIRMGQQVSENYGPIFTQKSRLERRTALKDQYWFDCNCTACEQNWPKFDDLDEGIMRFKCDAGNDCKNIIPVPINCSEFLIQCGLCQQFTNIFKGLKALQDTETAQKLGKDYMEKCDYSKALTKFYEELKIYDETLAPPFKDYHLCQQNIRQCLLTYGNVAFN